MQGVSLVTMAPISRNLGRLEERDNEKPIRGYLEFDSFVLGEKFIHLNCMARLESYAHDHIRIINGPSEQTPYTISINPQEYENSLNNLE